MYTYTNTVTGMPVRSYAQKSKGGRGTHRPRENTNYGDTWNTFYRDRENTFNIEGRTDSHTPSVRRAAVSRVASAIQADKVQQTAGETQTRARLSKKANTHTTHLCQRRRLLCTRESSQSARGNARVPTRRKTHARERHGTQGASGLGRLLAAPAGLRQGARG